MDFEKQAPDEIVGDADVALEGEIPDDAAEAVAGGRTDMGFYAPPTGNEQAFNGVASVKANGTYGRRS